MYSHQMELLHKRVLCDHMHKTWSGVDLTVYS